MFCSIVGIQYVKSGAFVHVVSKRSFVDDTGVDTGVRVEKVFVKIDSYVYSNISIGQECYLSYNKVDDKYYANIKI